MAGGTVSRLWDGRKRCTSRGKTSVLQRVRMQVLDLTKQLNAGHLLGLQYVIVTIFECFTYALVPAAVSTSAKAGRNTYETSSPSSFLTIYDTVSWTNIFAIC